MKSLYGRQFLLTAGMILISFALLGTAFIGLSYQYTIRETRDSMERNADYVADFTAKVRAEGIDVRDMAYQLYVANVAHIANAFVLVTEADGELVLCSDGATIQSGLGGNYLPQSIVSQLQKEGGYSGMTTLGGLFPEKRFVAGTPITVKTVNLATGQTEQTMIGVAYVAAETSDITELWQAFISIFFFTAVVVLCVAFITSSITSLRLTNPLKEIAETARKFGHGEYEVRVQGYEKRKDEVGELAEAFNAMADSIAKSEARRSEFVANISHELKTPLTSIKGFTDMLASGMVASPEDQKRFITMIGVEVDRLIDLINDILKLSELESVTIPQSEERSDVLTIARDTAAFLTPTAKAAEVTLSVDGGPATVAVPQGRLKELLLNLVGNGIKYNEPGGTVHTAVSVRDGQAVIAVSDTGIGIPPEAQSRVFERFYRVDKGRARKNGGTGLGLAIVKHIVQLYGGTLTLESAVGKGSTFTVTLPLAKDNA